MNGGYRFLRVLLAISLKRSFGMLWTRKKGNVRMANEMTHPASPGQSHIGSRMMKMVAILVATFCTISCASFSSSEWRSGHISRVLRSGEVIPDADDRCIDAATKRSDGAVALVRIRVGRAPHSIAVPFDPKLALVPGERVFVEMTSCQLWRPTL